VAGGGTVQLNGKADPINSTDSAMTPMTAALRVTQVDPLHSGLTDFAPDMAGVISFDGSGSSDGQTMQARGKLKVEKLKPAQKGTAAARPVKLEHRAYWDPEDAC
jgi:hypothetical protein